jgi:dTDP-4-dehydrorhamnose 3,5-epimerase
MKIQKTEINGLCVIAPDVFKDERGFFLESFHEKKYAQELPRLHFVQDNVSSSQFGTIRGLHYQVGAFAQGKLCQVIVGNVLDVAVDIRFGSPTFGKPFTIELSGENHLQLWIPPGFAHGFSVLSETAIFHYKCSALYDKPSERTLRYNDPDLKIDWRIAQPIVSEKDKTSKMLKEIEKDFLYEQLQIIERSEIPLFFSGTNY